MLRLRIVFLDSSRIVTASAIVADGGGLVFVPLHLIDGADVLDVELAAHQHATGELLYQDPSIDVAVLFVDGPALPDPPRWKTTTGDRLSLISPDGSTPVTVASDQTIHSPATSGRQGGNLLMDSHGDAVGMVVDRDKDELIIAPADRLIALRDAAVREANAGRATPFAPGSVKP